MGRAERAAGERGAEDGSPPRRKEPSGAEALRPAAETPERAGRQEPSGTRYRGGLGAARTAEMEPGPGPAAPGVAEGPEPEGAGVPRSACPFLAWSAEEVAEWVAELGFPQYQECFKANGVTGRRLILANCSNLPAMGVTDFGHTQEISRRVRELLGIEEPLFNRSIALPYRDNMGLFLERKSRSGKQADALTFSQFVQEARLESYTAVPPLQRAQAGVEADALPVPQGTQRQD
ncbi:sterile alpha motif domain-containing protein 15 [Porphyrio hochstetteri]